jgi:hypothetical protein
VKAIALCLLALIGLAVPAPASAKVPWHSVEILPDAPVADEPLTVVVRFWDDAGHSRPTTSWPGPATEGILAFTGPARTVPLTLSRIGDGAFRAEVSLPAGTWHLMVAGDHTGGAPTGVELASVTVAARPDVTAPLGAAGVGALIVAAAIVRRARRSASPNEPG